MWYDVCWFVLDFILVSLFCGMKMGECVRVYVWGIERVGERRNTRIWNPSTVRLDQFSSIGIWWQVIESKLFPSLKFPNWMKRTNSTMWNTFDHEYEEFTSKNNIFICRLIFSFIQWELNSGIFRSSTPNSRSFTCVVLFIINVWLEIKHKKTFLQCNLASIQTVLHVHIIFSCSFQFQLEYFLSKFFFVRQKRWKIYSSCLSEMNSKCVDSRRSRVEIRSCKMMSVYVWLVSARSYRCKWMRNIPPRSLTVV